MIERLFHLVTLPKCCTMKSMNILGYCNNHSSGNPVIAWFTQSCPCFHSYLVLVPCARHPAFQEADSATNFEFLRFTFGWDNVFIPLLLFNSVGQIRNRHRMKESTWNRLQYNWTGLKKPSPSNILYKVVLYAIHELKQNMTNHIMEQGLLEGYSIAQKTKMIPFTV